MIDKNSAISKIKFQVSKRKKEHISDERKIDMVQGIINANVNSEYIIGSEMPTDIMGVEIDWDKGRATRVVKRESIRKEG